MSIKQHILIFCISILFVKILSTFLQYLSLRIGIFFSLYVFVHVYTSAHAYVYVCVEARSRCQVSSLLALYLSFQREPLFELEAHWFQLGWLVNKPQSSSCLCFPRIDIWTQVLLLFYGNHLTNCTISPAPDNALKIIFMYSIILYIGVCIYMCLDTEMPHCSCGGQSTTQRSLFSFLLYGS